MKATILNTLSVVNSLSDRHVSRRLFKLNKFSKLINAFYSSIESLNKDKKKLYYPFSLKNISDGIY
jgi:hypothetical protein